MAGDLGRSTTERSATARASTGVAAVLLGAVLAGLPIAGPASALTTANPITADPITADPITADPITADPITADPSSGTQETALPTDTPTDLVPTTPAGSPTGPPDQTTPPPSDNPPAPPPTHGPPTQTPPPGPVPPGSMVSVRATSTNAVLGAGYWSGDAATSFTITVTNTGTGTEHVDVRYTLPAGTTDSGATSCRGGTCSVGSLAPGRSAYLRINLTVAANAWRSAPLGGQVGFTATGAGAPPATGRTSWSVVFPPGPPTPGIGLQVTDVSLGGRVDQPGQLGVKLSNTSSRPAAGVVTVVVPPGVTFGAPPADCRSHQQLDPTTMECGLGTVPAGAQRALSVPLLVSSPARERTPLAGLVRATLTRSGQGPAQTQASYQILAPGQSGVLAGSSAAPSPSDGTTGPATAGNQATVRRPAGGDLAVWPIIAGSLLLLAAAGVGLVRVRRTRRPGPLAVAPAAGQVPVTAMAGGPGVPDPVPTPRGPIRFEWTEVPDAPPPGVPESTGPGAG